MCDLCKLVETAKAGKPTETPLHFHNCVMVIADCKTCKPIAPGEFQPKIVVYAFHGKTPSTVEKWHMRAIAKKLWPGHLLDHQQRSIRDHWHFHVR